MTSVLPRRIYDNLVVSFAASASGRRLAASIYQVGRYPDPVTVVFGLPAQPLMPLDFPRNEKSWAKVAQTRRARVPGS